MTTPNSRPAWGADVPVSMPIPPPADEPVLVSMFGLGMTRYRLVHALSSREYQDLSVPVYQPADPSAPVSQDDAAIDSGGVPSGMP